jgi:hypothetical protein
MFPQQGSQPPAGAPRLAAPEEPAGPESGNTLEDAARDERDYVRQRLRRELDRDPTDEEINDWLRKHTEGY